MCKNHANLKRSSDCHENFKLTTRMQGSEHHQKATKFPDYEKDVRLTRFSDLPHKFQAYDKNVNLRRLSNLSQSF